MHVPVMRNFEWCSHQESNLERLLTMEVLYHLTMGASYLNSTLERRFSLPFKRTQTGVHCW